MLICYDISDQNRRTRIFKILKDYGNNVQFSIFECSIDQKTYSELENKLKTEINSQDDSIKIYFFCSSCESKIKNLGKTNEDFSTGAIII